MVRYLGTLILFAFLAFSVPGHGSENPKNLFVIVTSDDPVTQLMSMVLATQASKKGATVDVLLCGKAGSLAVRDSAEIFLKPNNKSPQMLLNKLIQDGVNVEICPPYLPNNDKAASDLINGVSVAKPPVVADKLLREDTSILSY